MPTRNSLCSCGSGKKFKHCHGKHVIASVVPTIFPFAARFDQLSLSSCYLDLFANGTRIGNATGFLWRHGEEVYLVTNWHVVTNKDIFTNDLLDGPTCPDVIRAYVSFRNEPTSADKD